MSELVLSLFPGLGLLDHAFETEGYCVVRGPDPIWGGDVKRFRPTPGRWDGAIGGPPCQFASTLRHLNPHCGEKHGNLIPEYERCVFEAQPAWFVMENVEDAPLPVVQGYQVWSQLVRDDHVGGLQPRKRRISFGTRDGRPLDIEYVALMALEMGPGLVLTGSNGGGTPGQRAKRALYAGGGRAGPDSGVMPRPRPVTGGHNPVPDKGPGGVILRSKRALTAEGRSTHRELREAEGSGARLPISECLRLQGLPANFCAESPFTKEALRKMLGNGVPQALGRAVARAVKKAMECRP